MAVYALPMCVNITLKRVLDYIGYPHHTHSEICIIETMAVSRRIYGSSGDLAGMVSTLAVFRGWSSQNRTITVGLSSLPSCSIVGWSLTHD